MGGSVDRLVSCPVFPSDTCIPPVHARNCGQHTHSKRQSDASNSRRERERLFACASTNSRLLSPCATAHRSPRSMVATSAPTVTTTCGAHHHLSAPHARQQQHQPQQQQQQQPPPPPACSLQQQLSTTRACPGALVAAAALQPTPTTAVESQRRCTTHLLLDLGFC